MSEKKVVTFGRVFWPSLLAVFIVSLIGMLIFLIVIGGLISGFSEQQPMNVTQNTVLHLTLEGDLAEKSSSRLDPASMSVQSVTGLCDILYGFERAEKDDRIKGVFLEIKGARCGMATAKEIRNAINRFEKKGKFVVAYLSGEVITQKQYYIASAANEIYAFPTSMMEFVGLGAELTFFKRTLDKLGVEIQVIRGRDNDFKSAVEPFFLEKMSDSSRVQVQRYLTSIWSDMRADIANDRKTSSERLFQAAENMEIKRAQDAVGLKLVDGVKYRDEVVAMLVKKTGQKKNELRLRSFEKYAKRKFKDNQSIVKMNNPNIAVLIAEGDISVNGEGLSSERICESLREIRQNKDIKILVLRINSPGGSALASDEIWREVKLLKERMKVIVSMGDVAASGGYYIAAPANYIFAENTTITGSIGVFGVIPYTGKFLEDKLGLTFDRVSTNKHAVVSPNRRLTPEETGMVQTEVDEIYAEFIQRVADGRGLSTERVHQLARGRVWTGTDALKIGLVDKLGGLDDAIKYAQKTAKLKDARVMYYPKHKEEPFDAILEILEEQDGAEMLVKDKQIPSEFMVYYRQLMKLEQVKGIQMRLPYEIKID
ncbi:MAG: sppA [Crocinitomicaceae bacterium]|jgi:protease-4|nr:sppA [Crocinitomicaceae bacterium]